MICSDSVSDSKTKFKNLSFSGQHSRESNPWPLRYRYSSLTNRAIKPTWSWSLFEVQNNIAGGFKSCCRTENIRFAQAGVSPRVLFDFFTLKRWDVSLSFNTVCLFFRISWGYVSGKAASISERSLWKTQAANAGWSFGKQGICLISYFL